MKRLSGKTALVTGGSTGIGLATARAFIEEGAEVFITGRRQAELDAAVKSLGKGAHGVQGDTSKLADLDRLFAEIKRQKGQLDVVFANAGIAEFGTLGELTEEHYDRIFDINVKGVLFTVQKALPLLKPGASIILNASVVASKGFGAMSVYSATKAALRSFARTWTTDLKGRNIRVNVVSPGPIATPGLAGLAPDEASGKKLAEELVKTVPLGRIGQPEDIARAVVFLASSESAFVTGTELFVDGGSAQV